MRDFQHVHAIFDRWERQAGSGCLPVEEYEELMQDVSDLAAVAERRNEERVTLEEVKQRLISDGLLPR